MLTKGCRADVERQGTSPRPAGQLHAPPTTLIAWSTILKSIRVANVASHSSQLCETEGRRRQGAGNQRGCGTFRAERRPIFLSSMPSSLASTTITARTSKLVWTGRERNIGEIAATTRYPKSYTNSVTAHAAIVHAELRGLRKRPIARTET